MKNLKVSKGIEIPCNERTFYRKWLSFLTPLHKFTPQVTTIAAELLRHREELSKVIKDENILSKVLLSQDIREQILKDCKVTLSTFRVTVNKLKKAGFLVDGKINSRFIPNVKPNEDFNLLLMFKFKNDSR